MIIPGNDTPASIAFEFIKAHKLSRQGIGIRDMEMNYKILKTDPEQKAIGNCHIEIQMLEKFSIHERNEMDYSLWQETTKR